MKLSSAKNSRKKKEAVLKSFTFNKIKEKIKNNACASEYLKESYSLFYSLKSRILSFSVCVIFVILICGITNALNLSLGYEVILDGEQLGIVTEKTLVYDAISEVKSDIKKYANDSAYSKDPVFILRMVQKDSLSEKEDIKEHLFSHVDYMVRAFGIYVNDQPALGVTSKEAADFVLKKHKKQMAQSDDAVLSFVEKVEIKEGHLHISLLKTPDDALKILKGENNKKIQEYVIKDGDSVSKIAQKYDLRIERLLALNDGLGTQIKAGDKIVVEKASPVISVKAEKMVEVLEEVPFEIKKINDSTLYEDSTKVISEGVLGESRVLYKITEINGNLASKEAVETTVIKEPTEKIEKIGTKKRPKAVGTGSFISPSYGTLSSRFGTRWNKNHTGIDISGEYNSPIKAADGGVVTFSGWMDGYGNYIIIDHKNGYETRYAHCSSLIVSEGAKVLKGDIIAKMGNTGRTTGTHLHFEVKKDGVFIDPLKFVTY